jgi:hypothetical protein
MKNRSWRGVTAQVPDEVVQVCDLAVCPGGVRLSDKELVRLVQHGLRADPVAEQQTRMC